MERKGIPELFGEFEQRLGGGFNTALLAILIGVGCMFLAELSQNPLAWHGLECGWLALALFFVLRVFRLRSVLAVAAVSLIWVVGSLAIFFAPRPTSLTEVRTVPNPKPTAMVRTFGGVYWDFSTNHYGQQSFYATICSANYGDEDVDVRFYRQGWVGPNDPDPTHQRAVIDRMEETLDRNISVGRGTFASIPPSGDGYLACQPPFFTDAYTIFSQILSRSEIEKMRRGYDVFYFLGRFVEKNSQGTTYYPANGPICGIILTISLPMICPARGSG